MAFHFNYYWNTTYLARAAFSSMNPRWARKAAASVIRLDARQVVGRTVRWARNLARGKDYRPQTIINAEFIEGGAIGPLVERVAH